MTRLASPRRSADLLGVRAALPDRRTIRDAFIPVLDTALNQRPSGMYAAVYTWADVAESALYAGCTDDLVGRIKHHIRGSSWTQFAAQGEVLWFPGFRDARVAEDALIAERKPLFNVAGNAAGSQRLVRYLIAHNRADLLLPNVRKA